MSIHTVQVQSYDAKNSSWVYFAFLNTDRFRGTRINITSVPPNSLLLLSPEDEALVAAGTGMYSLWVSPGNYGGGGRAWDMLCRSGLCSLSQVLPSFIVRAPCYLGLPML